MKETIGKINITAISITYYKERDIYLLVIDFYNNDRYAAEHTSHVLDDLSEVVVTLEQFDNYHEFCEPVLQVNIS